MARGDSIGALVDELARIIPNLDVDIGEIVALFLSIESGMGARQLESDLLDQLVFAGADAAPVATDELAPVLDYLASDPRTQRTVDELAVRQLRDGRVYVTTLSAGKGLEFDYVFIPNCDDVRMPFYRSLHKPRELDEERNKFYACSDTSEAESDPLVCTRAQLRRNFADRGEQVAA